MKRVNPLKEKYHSFYWSVAKAAATQSVATRHKVGAVAVTESGLLIPGWNGTIPGADNNCETGPIVEGGRRKTGPLVLHAENNILGKASVEGISLYGAHLFITRAPCLSCARALIPSGIVHVHYLELHDDIGIEVLKEAGMIVTLDAY